VIGAIMHIYAVLNEEILIYSLFKGH